MESSTVLAFRIFVMLSCLVVVPMAAIFGSAFPDVVKSVLVDRIVAWGTGKSTEPVSKDAGPGFSQLKPVEGAGMTQGDPNIREAPRWGAPTTNAASWPAQEGVAQAAAVMPAAAGMQPGDQPTSLAVANDSGRGTSSPYAQDRTASEAPPYDAPDNARPGNQLSYPAGIAGARGPGAAEGRIQPLEAPDRFTAMERRLREYGATYYLLETWGKDGELYRFHCKMAVGNNPNYTRHFEATDSDALKAMGQVLERVEAWRAGRPQ